MSTEDIENYFGKGKIKKIYWLNDFSCKLIYFRIFIKKDKLFLILYYQIINGEMLIFKVLLNSIMRKEQFRYFKN
jgi:hypothetical protein